MIYILSITKERGDNRNREKGKGESKQRQRNIDNLGESPGIWGIGNPRNLEVKPDRALQRVASGKAYLS